MIVKYPCLLCNKTVVRNHKAVQYDCCDRWVHIACNYLNVYTYWKLQKDKSPWYCLCCFKKEMPFCSRKNKHLQELMPCKIILSPNKKIMTNAIRQNEIIDEELQKKQTICSSHWTKLIMLSRIYPAGKYWSPGRPKDVPFQRPQDVP